MLSLLSWSWVITAERAQLDKSVVKMNASLWYNKVLSYTWEVKGRDYFASFSPAVFTIVRAFIFYSPSSFIHMVKHSISICMSGAVLC